MADSDSSLPPETSEEQDSAYNPGEQINREKMSAGFTPGQSKKDSKDGNTDGTTGAVKEKEESADDGMTNGFYRKSGKKKRSFTSLKGWRKKSATVGIVGAFALGGGALTLLFSPGLAIVQLKEIMSQDLNDQLAAVDLRTDAMWRAKLGQFESGLCTNMAKIKCQFSTMSKRQIERFKKAGFVIDDANLKDTAFGRQRITSMTAPNGAVISDPQDLFNERRNPEVRTSMNRVFNPIYASLSDTVANNTFTKRFFTSKAAKLAGTTPEALDESMTQAVSGDDALGTQKLFLDDGDGRNYMFNEQGERIYLDENPDEYNRLLDAAKIKAAEIDEKAKSLDTGVKAVSGVLSGALKGFTILGVADTACSVYNAARAVAAAAKATRAIQLAQYAMVYLNVADKIKAGEATPEEVAYLGDRLTEVDTNQKIVDELSAVDTTEGVTAEDLLAGTEGERDNPFYGKNAFDSPGYAVAQYNDAPTLTTRSQQYMVGGGLSGSLSSVTTDIASTFPGGVDGLKSTCGVIQSWWVRGAGLIIGVAAAIGSFGASTVISVGASIAVAMALPFLEAALADIIAGQVVGPDTASVDAGDAIFSGTSTLLGGVAQARGMSPSGTVEEVQSYAVKNNETQDQYIAQARYEAQATPFDIMNPYSFLGSMARTLNLPAIEARTGATGALAAIPQLLSASVGSLIPSANAQVSFNPERFSKCNDEAYLDIGIGAADVFCNVRYSLTDEELAKDSIQVVDYMLANKHIDPNGTPLSEDYKNFMKYCVNRTEGWGEIGVEQENDWTSGKACMGTSPEVDLPTLGYLRIYTFDKTISEAMDDEPPAEPGADGGGAVVGGTKQEIAQRILAKGNVSLYGDVVPTLEQIASGSVNPDTTPCGVNIYILKIIDAISNSHSILVTDINRTCKGIYTPSRHSAGNGSAVDIAVVDGSGVSGRDGASVAIINIAMPYLVEAAGISGQLSGVGQVGCGASISLGAGVQTFEDSCNHVHMDVGPRADPALEYTSGW